MAMSLSFYSLKFPLSLRHLSLPLGFESLTLFFNLSFKQPPHGVLSGDVHRKFTLAVHGSHMSAVFDQVPATVKKKTKMTLLQW